MRKREKTIQEKARYLLNKAVKEGRIIKPSTCSDCSKSGVIIDGHHEDYSKPLEVIWLCKKCHAKIPKAKPAIIKQATPGLNPKTRKVVMIKGSLYVCIPMKFVEHYNIKVGDPMVLIPRNETIGVLPMRGD
jgi:hypothetical protein